MKRFTKSIIIKFILLVLLWSGSEIHAQNFCNNNNLFTANITVTTTVQTTPIVSTGRRIYVFNANLGELFTFSTCALTTLDTRLRIYSTATGGTILAESDDDCGLQTTLTWNAPANGTYSVFLTGIPCSALGGTATSMSYVKVVPINPCLSTPAITCGTSITSNLGVVGANTLTSCDGLDITPGQELIYTYTPPTTGLYSVNITSSSGTSDFVDFFYKQVSQGCNGTNWQCFSGTSLNGTGTLGPVSLTAGVAYYIMIDRENFSSNTGTATKVWNLGCAMASPCASIINIPSICPNSATQSASFSGAGLFGIEFCGTNVFGNEKIYSYTPTVSGMHSLNITAAAGAQITYGYKLASAGCSDAVWNCIDNFNSPASASFGPLTAGVQYLILQDAGNLAARSQSFNIGCTVPGPANDLCTGAIPIACGGSYSGNTSGASDETISPSCGSTSNGFNRGVWHTVTLSAQGTISLSLCGGSTWDTYLRLFSGSCASLSCIEFDDDGCGATLQSQLTSPVIPAGTYYILVSGYDSDSEGAYTLNVNCTVCPSPPTGGTVSGPTSGCSGSNFTYNATGYSGNIQWQVATGVVPGTFADIPGANSNTLVYTAASANTFHFRIKASGNSCLDAFSNVISNAVINSGVVL